MGYYEGEIGTLCGNNQNNGWNDWSWIIGLALVGGLFGGWGNGGFGFGGNRGGVGENYVLATDFATIERKLDGVNNGLCDGFYAQNTNMLNGFASVQSALCQGFNGLQQTAMQGIHGLDNAVCTLGYQTQTAIADVKYANERNTADIIGAINAGNQRLVDIYTADKIEALRAENTALRGRISDDIQADRIISKLSPCPSPAYIVPNPNCCYQYGVNGVGYAQNGCGCGC